MDRTLCFEFDADILQERLRDIILDGQNGSVAFGGGPAEREIDGIAMDRLNQRGRRTDSFRGENNEKDWE